MRHSLSLFRTIVKHKWYVMKAGRRFGVSWYRLLVHDLSKLSPAEFIGYRNKFHAGVDDPDGFAQTWRHHLEKNDHHWQHPSYEDGAKPMPEQCVREMVADWISAGIAYGGKNPDVNDWPWLRENMPRMILHNTTFETLVDVLREMGASEKTIDEIRTMRRPGGKR